MATDTETKSDDKSESKSKVPYPDRADDGCVYCGMVLLTRNERGDLERNILNEQEHMASGCEVFPKPVFDKKGNATLPEYAAIKAGQ